MLLRRAFTALLLGPAVIGLVVLGDPWYSLAVALAAAIGTWELHGLLEAMGLRGHLALRLFLSLTFLGSATLGINATLTALALTSIVPALAALATVGPPEDRVASWASTALASLYMGWLPAHFLMLYRLHDPTSPSGWLTLELGAGTRWVLLTLLLTWCADIFAYVAGKTLGRHPMAPTISPGKTWEGTAAGAAACAVTAYPLATLLGLPIAFAEAIPLGAGLALVGQLGDLAESLIKRAARAKDSSGLLPGHGGLLDRMDSLLFTITIMYYYVLWLKP